MPRSDGAKPLFIFRNNLSPTPSKLFLSRISYPIEDHEFGRIVPPKGETPHKTDRTMENTFSTCRKAFRCKNQYEAFVTLTYLFQSVADVPYWLEKTEEIQRAAFDHHIDFEKTSSNALIYYGQLILKIIYASIHLQEFPAIDRNTLSWDQLVDSWIRNRCKKESDTLLPLQILQYGPKNLSQKEILDPSAFIKVFHQKQSLKKWIKRWNQLREMAFYSDSIFEGDEGEYLEDFTYFKKLLEASYLILVRYSPI